MIPTPRPANRPALGEAARFASWLAVLGLLVAAGCARHEPADEKPAAVERHAERGPFKLAVTLRPARALVGDRVELTATFTAPPDYVARFADDPNQPAWLLETDDLAGPDPVGDGTVQWRRRLVLRPVESGRLALGCTVRYGRRPAQGEPVYDHELSVEPLEVEVAGVLTSRDAVDRPRQITGPVMPPGEPLGPVQAGLLAGAVVGVLAALLYLAWRRRARRPATAPELSPEQWALRELARLEASGLLERGQVRRFYYELSEIVRRFVEKRFGLAAPEMTTEEFLGALARDRGAVPYDADRLGDFLRACDLVKYAALDPGPEQGAAALAAARAFVQATTATSGAPEPASMADVH